MTLAAHSRLCGSLATMALLVSGCSGMVAPVNSGGGVPSSINTEESSGNAAATADGAGAGAKTTAANLGKFSETSGDALKPVSGYAMYTDMGMMKSLSVVLTEGAVGESSFKKIASWECKACSGDNDPNCKAQTGNTEVKNPASYSITFMKPFMASDTAAATADGWPKAALTTIDATQTEATVSAGFSAGGSAAAMPVKGTGTIDFGSTIPTKVGDKFTALIDFDFGGKMHKTKLESVVVTQGTPVAPPADCTLANKKYPVPKYE